MGVTNTFHRPLTAGIGISASDGSSATLTGLATRRADGKRVLVTNRHLMATSASPNPEGEVFVYQPDDSNIGHKVGKLLAWDHVSSEVDNVADVAIAELSPGIDAGFQLYNSTDNMGTILPGVEEPTTGMRLTVAGAEGGTDEVVVELVDEEIDLHTGGVTLTYTGVVLLNTTGRAIMEGDSGAPCLLPVENNPSAYRMSCVILSGRNISSANQGFAFPASVAEKELGIVFGRQNQITERVAEEGEQGRGGGKEPEQGNGNQPGDRGPGGHRRIA